MKRPSKTRVIALFITILIVGFAIRESRLLWEIEELKYFDFAYWGINISNEVYTMQNMISIFGLFIILIYLIRRDSLVIQFDEPQINAPVFVSLGEAQPRSRKGREKNPDDNKDGQKHPFEMVNRKRWKLVFPKDKKKEGS